MIKMTLQSLDVVIFTIVITGALMALLYWVHSLYKLGRDEEHHISMCKIEVNPIYEE